MKESNVIEIQLGMITKQRDEHMKKCSECHLIELNKSTGYCAIAEGLKYWISALTWVLQ